MIETELLKSWLSCGLRFANLSAAFTDTEAAHALSGTDDVPTELRAELAQWDEMRDDKPLAPESGYQELHRAWRTFLKVLVSGKRKEWLQRWCIDRSMGRLGDNNFFVETGPDVSPFGFDDNGRPQLGLIGWRRPEGMLAVVGAELISPEPPFAVRVCARTGCGVYFANPLYKRGRGAPSKHCGPACGLSSTDRGRKRRAKIKARRKR